MIRMKVYWKKSSRHWTRHSQEHSRQFQAKVIHDFYISHRCAKLCKLHWMYSEQFIKIKERIDARVRRQTRSLHSPVQKPFCRLHSLAESYTVQSQFHIDPVESNIFFSVLWVLNLLTAVRGIQFLWGIKFKFTFKYIFRAYQRAGSRKR